MAQHPWKVAARFILKRDDAALSERLAPIPSHGADSVFLMMSETATAWDEEACRIAAAIVRRRGLSVAGCAFESTEGASFISTDADVRRWTRGDLVAAMDRAAWLGASMMLLPVPVFSSSDSTTARPSYDDTFFRASEALLDLRFEAEQRAVVIGCGVPSQRILLSPLEARSFLDRVNSPWVRASVDADVAMRYSDVADWIVALRHRVAMIYGGNVSSFGPQTAVAAALVQVRFDGAVVIPGPDSGT